MTHSLIKSLAACATGMAAGVALIVYEDARKKFGRDERTKVVLTELFENAVSAKRFDEAERILNKLPHTPFTVRKLSKVTSRTFYGCSDEEAKRILQMLSDKELKEEVLSFRNWDCGKPLGSAARGGNVPVVRVLLNHLSPEETASGNQFRNELGIDRCYTDDDDYGWALGYIPEHDYECARVNAVTLALSLCSLKDDYPCHEMLKVLSTVEAFSFLQKEERVVEHET